MNLNDLLDYIDPPHEETLKNEFIEDLFWEGPFGEADCAGL